MKKITTLLLVAGLMLGTITSANAIEFKAKGQFNFGFGFTDTQFYGERNGSDVFGAQQRVRLQLEAIASESLSGTVHFEMGDTMWGNGSSGGALGADGKIVELKQAYIDWFVPNTELSFRMGIQALALPHAAGGAQVFTDDGAGIVASYKINDNVGITGVWARPYNDNFGGETNRWDNSHSANYLDNIDLFALTVPISGDGWSINPWIGVGIVGENSFYSSEDYYNDGTYVYAAGDAVIKPRYGLLPHGISNGITSVHLKDQPAYGTAVWAGLPVKFNKNNFNVEFDFNYGDTGYMGTTDFGPGIENWDVRRSGWMAKALFEYKMDWGTPGIFAWYASGDDGDASNGSEMMPYLKATGNFTHFMGDGDELGWSVGSGYDLNLTYAGTWGIGLRLKKMSFIEDLSHTFRVAYWGGTNSPEMVDEFGLTANNAYNMGLGSSHGAMYLTTADHLIEFNFDTTYQIYENLQAIVQLGYIVNGIDEDTWKGMQEKRDAYKAQLIFSYSF